MRKIKTSEIVGGLGMTGQSGVLEHLQFADTELAGALINTIAGKKLIVNTVYILYGCVNSTPGTGTFTISSGHAAFDDGTTGPQVYFVPATTITPGGGLTLVIKQIQSQYTAVDSGGNKKGDPVTFSDNTTKNVLDIFTMKFVAGTSGSQLSDYADLVFIQTGWHEVGATGEPAFLNGYVNSNPSYKVKFKKSIGGVVSLIGKAANPGAMNVAIFTLPAGFRPVQQVNFFVTSDGVNPAVGYQVVISESTGDVVVTETSASNKILRLDSIRFCID